jgi:hypothetical protein
MFEEEKHPRDERGQFSPSEGARAQEIGRQSDKQAAATIDRLARSRRSSSELHQKALRDAGFTYDVVRDVFPERGFVVSIHPGHERRFSAEEFNEDVLQTYIDERADVFEKYPNARVGAWYDASIKTWFLDVSHVETTREGAIEMAKQHDQRAIFDLEKKETIYVEEVLKRWKPPT